MNSRIAAMSFLILCVPINSHAQLATDTNAKVESAPPTKQSAAPSFLGRWSSTFGEIELSSSGKFVVGKYPTGTLKGAVFGNSLAFRYQDSAERGMANFKLSEDGNSFTGRYLAQGTTEWKAWNGRRAMSRGFAGLWDTNYGKLRLHVEENKVTGFYNLAGQDATIEGEIKGQRMEFRYREPMIKGSAWFELSDDDETITGKFRADGQQEWHDWIGDREAGAIGEKWLVILEANWEASLGEAVN